MFPIESLSGAIPQLGLVVALVIGFGFGFVLEQAGFGRSTKLAAQFYLYDMTVFKVMFGAIVTAMLGTMVAAGLGLVDLAALSEGVVSTTYLWPMIVGGLLLGAGFIISGYCPGTSVVGAASGNIDGVVTIVGVAVGSLVFAEAVPSFEGFFVSGDQGQLFLYQWLGISPVILAVVVAIVAVAAFVGAEYVEKFMTARLEVAKTVVDEEVRSARAPKQLTFGIFATVAIIALLTMLIPLNRPAEATPAQARLVAAGELAHIVFDEPWNLRIIDVRSLETCSKKRIPGSECVAAEELGDLGLPYGPGQRSLVYVDKEGGEAPSAILEYPGEIMVLDGGFAAWENYALAPPASLPEGSSDAELAELQFRQAISAALSGQKPPPPPKASKKYVPKKKKKEGGCG
ncbi:MAG: YeeE/YedE family protein [Proteobacteria bacterium]|nr:YeeE/YedE family protein [Pseudomonadota bacterium]